MIDECSITKISLQNIFFQHLARTLQIEFKQHLSQIPSFQLISLSLSLPHSITLSTSFSLSLKSILFISDIHSISVPLFLSLSLCLIQFYFLDHTLYLSLSRYLSFSRSLSLIQFYLHSIEHIFMQPLSLSHTHTLSDTILFLSFSIKLSLNFSLILSFSITL